MRVFLCFVRVSALKIPVITTKIPGCEDAVVDDYNGCGVTQKTLMISFLKWKNFETFICSNLPNGSKWKK